MKGSRAWLAVLVCGLVPVAAGCTADGAGRAGGSAGASVTASASPSCARGAIHWGRVTKETELLGVSPVIEVAKTDGKVRFPLDPVRSVASRVEVSDATVSARRVFAALARRLDVDASVLRSTTSEAVRKGVEVDFLGGAGRFVEAAGAQVVRASFTVDCPAAPPARGSVTGYYSSSGASLQCGVDPGKEGGKLAWVQEAYDMTCGPARPATASPTPAARK